MLLLLRESNSLRDFPDISAISFSKTFLLGLLTFSTVFSFFMDIIIIREHDFVKQLRKFFQKFFLNFFKISIDMPKFL